MRSFYKEALTTFIMKLLDMDEAQRKEKNLPLKGRIKHDFSRFLDSFLPPLLEVLGGKLLLRVYDFSSLLLRH